MPDQVEALQKIADDSVGSAPNLVEFQEMSQEERQAAIDKMQPKWRNAWQKLKPR